MTPSVSCLSSGLIVEVVPGQPLTEIPRWTIDDLSVGPFLPEPAYYELSARTVGSDFVWTDEFTFNRETLLLEAFILHVPERNSEREGLSAWLDRPVFSGLLRWQQPDFIPIETTTFRQLTADGAALICIDEDQDPPARGYRINLAPSFDLLCEGERYLGWMQHGPVQHLVPGPGPRAPFSLTLENPRLVERVREYHQLVSKKTTGRLHEDLGLKAALVDLRARIGSFDPPSQALRGRIDELFDTFYWRDKP